MSSPTTTLCSPDTRRDRQFLPPPPSAPEFALWCGRHKSASGYRNVYFDPKGGGSWRVRVCKRVNLPGRWRSARDAAAAQVAFYERFYGPLGCDWRKAARNRRKNLGRVTRHRGGFWLAHVFVLGSPSLVSGDYGNANLPSHTRHAGLPPSKPPELGRWKYATRGEALAAVREWLRRFRDSLGSQRRFAGLYLWRA